MKKFLTLFLCIVLCLTVFGVIASADTDVFFAAVDYKVLPLKTENIPIRSGGKLYVPLGALTSSTGIHSSISDNGRYVSLFARDKELTFDIAAAVSFDRDTQYSYYALRQSGLYYLPVENVCKYFDIGWAELSSDKGPVLRLRTTSTASTDQHFLDAAQDSLKAEYDAYTGVAATPLPPVGSPPVETTAAPPTPTPAASRPIVYLTFDDGPTHAYSHAILDILDEYDVKATFFILGSNMKKAESAVRRMMATGHAIGVHSFTHEKDLVYASPEALVDEMERANDELERITLFRSRLVRIPFGSGGNKYFTTEMCQALTDSGFRFWDWNVDGDPPARPSAADVAAGVISDLQRSELSNGQPAIILLHERGKTVEALPAILEYMKSKNYIFEICDQSERPYNHRSWIK